MSSSERTAPELRVGPILYARGADERSLRLTALLVAGPEPPALYPDVGPEVRPRLAYQDGEIVAWLYDFELPARSDTSYRLAGKRYPVNASLGHDLRVAFMACNGEVDETLSPPDERRNQMWHRLAEEHRRNPFNLLLHGGDQIYADGVLHSHRRLSRWRYRAVRPFNDEPFSDEMRAAARRFLFRRYCAVLSQPQTSLLMAEVPSLMMWDDHDIIDGWGSLEHWRMDSHVGEGLFDVARQMFLLFQRGLTPWQQPAAKPPLTWEADFPGLRIVAPDLRSERTEHRVFGVPGWTTFEDALSREPEVERVLVMFSVPLVAPRYRWLEPLTRVIPGAEDRETDLLDQWQSRYRRDEWRRVLEHLCKHAARIPTTVLSGEVHLAGRGQFARGGATIEQLIASGIAHEPPPRIYAWFLRILGAARLRGLSVRSRRLPGRAGAYYAERNFLVLTRTAGKWQACWELERSGRTKPLDL